MIRPTENSRLTSGVIFGAILPLLWLAGAGMLQLTGNGAGEVTLTQVFAAPAADAPLGRDELGRSLLPRVVSGGGLSLLIALVTIAVSATLGTVIGIVSGWLGGRVDQLVVRVIDIFLAFPGILLAIAIAGLMGPGIGNVFIALVTVGWVGFARLARAQALSLRSRDHVLVARALGTPTWRILLRHVLPLMAAPLLVEASFGVAGVIVAEAGLSFLGLGVQAPTPSWGSMLRDGMQYLPLAPHLVLVPGSALFLTVLGVNALGDRLRDAIAPGAAATRA